MCMHVSAYIFERSGYTPPLTTLDVHHNNIYAHIYLYVLMHVPCLYDLKLRCMSRVWCVRIVMAFNGLSILLSEKKTQCMMVHVRVVGGSHATALHTISLASSTSNTYSSLVIRLAHPWELRISNGGNKTHTTATPLLNTALWYAIPTTEIRVMHWGRGTVEPLYNGHFGTSHFWVIFAVI